MDLKKLMFDFSSISGSSGRETPAAEFACGELSKYADAHIDEMGNVIGEIGGKGCHIMLDAHIDQIGFVVTAIDDGGFLKVAKCGGIDTRILFGREVVVYGREPLYGVFCCMPPHLSKGEDMKKVPGIEDFSVDIGLSAEKARNMVKQGDRVVFRQKPAQLLNDRIAGPAFDDRAGVASILRCLDILKDRRCDCRLTALFSVQEEVGTRGAGPAAFGEKPDEAIAIDVSFAMTPDCPRHKCGDFGKGPMIGISPTLSHRMTTDFGEIAEEKNIPHQFEVMGGTTGTNADVISSAGAGIETGLLSIPLRYMHTANESVCLADVENTAQLLAEYIVKRGGGKND